MTKRSKRGDPDQPDMFGHFNPRVGSMRKLRQERRDAGFTEVVVWVPEERKEELKQLAKDWVRNCPRDMPRSG